MKKMFLAALTVLSLGAGAANAQSLSHATPQQSAARRIRGPMTTLPTAWVAVTPSSRIRGFLRGPLIVYQ